MDIAGTCLVIDSRRLDQLSLDGPALKVRLHAQSARLFPLRRLSRIHVVGAITDGLEPLLHCAEHQIPVAFFTLTGKLRCQLYFPINENSLISHWLDHVDFDVEAKQIYEEWLLHQTLHMLSMVGHTVGNRESRYKLVNESLRSICKRFLGSKDFQSAMDWLNGILAVHLSQLIVDYGLSNQSRGKRRLMQDISPVCELWLVNILATKAGKHRIKITAQTMSDFYQQQSGQIEYTARRMLTQLVSSLESII